jgi:hypothetical protein
MLPMRDLFDPDGKDLEDAESRDFTSNAEARRRLRYYRNSKEDWMRDLAQQIDEGVLPLSAVMRVPPAMQAGNRKWKGFNPRD